MFDAILQEAQKNIDPTALNIDDPNVRIPMVNHLWRLWADFEIYVISPTLEILDPPKMIDPEPLIEGGGDEFVYSICDHGYKLSTSKAEDAYLLGQSMCKLFYTIEKMIQILVQRLKDGGIDDETEVQVAFSGHELSQRKGFEVVINLPMNMVVTNFDPGSWGEQYLETVKNMSDKYGFPPSAPRDIYRHNLSHSSKK